MECCSNETLKSEFHGSCDETLKHSHDSPLDSDFHLDESKLYSVSNMPPIMQVHVHTVPMGICS